VLVNGGHHQVLIVDLAAHQLVPVRFPEVVGAGFLIAAWLVAPDGRSSYLFSSDPLGFGLALDHRSASARPFRVPLYLPAMTDVCWVTGDKHLREVHLLDHQGHLWTLQGDLLVPARAETYEVEPALTHARWRARGFGSLKPDFNTGGLYLLSRDRIGFLPPRSDQPVLAAVDEEVLDLTQHQGRLFLCRKRTIRQESAGQSLLVLEADAGRSFCAVELVRGPTGARLAVLSTEDVASADSRPRRCLDFYELR
jgi:hypothetical protein